MAHFELMLGVFSRALVQIHLPGSATAMAERSIFRRESLRKLPKLWEKAQSHN
jgi:hypothetical protein